MKLTMPWTAPEIHLNGVGGKLDDVRQALGREVDQLADVGSQAATAARDTSTHAGEVVQKVLAQRARDLGSHVQSMGHDLRQMRLTTEPRRKGRDVLPGLALLGGLGAGFGAGLALTYFLDPDRGRDRRTLLRDRLTKLTRLGRQTVADTARGFRNRSVGVMDEPREIVQPDSHERAAEGIPVPIG